jgi:hypothetical protein
MTRTAALPVGYGKTADPQITQITQITQIDFSVGATES